MGGSGSTRWEGVRVRSCVESCFTIEAPRGPVSEGQRARAWWPRSGVTATCYVLTGGFSPVVSLRHDYAGGGEQCVALVSTPANLGGRRWWFRCPTCRARARTLHLPRGSSTAREFRCRRCYDLTYESAQDSRTLTQAFFRLCAREWGCSQRKARDRFRREALRRGGGLYERRRLYFGEHKEAGV